MRARLPTLISRDVLLDARDSPGRTALLAATHANRIEAGTAVNARDEIGDSPYLCARARGYTQIADILEKAGAK